jgi:hypothetical protein
MHEHFFYIFGTGRGGKGNKCLSKKSTSVLIVFTCDKLLDNAIF